MIALVTGVSREMGLGFGVARLLAEKGFQVVITARDIAKAEELATKLKTEGHDVTAAAMDVTSDASVEQCAKYVTDTFGSLDVLINNAATGYEFEHDMLNTSLANVEAALATNVIGVWRTCNAFLPVLRNSSQPRIVNVSSESGSFGSEGGLNSPYTLGMLSAYSVSKAALNAYTVKFAQSLQSTDVLVNAVHPGFTATYEGLADQGARAASESAVGVIWAATLPKDGPTGGFFCDGKPMEW